MLFPKRTFRDSGTTAAPSTTTAAYVAVPLLWTTTGGTPLYFDASYHGGPIGGTVRNTHASLTMKMKVTATSSVGSDSLPSNSDPTLWPVDVAEATIAAASDANFFINVAHHLFYAICVIDGSGHATFTVQAVHKPLA